MGQIAPSPAPAPRCSAEPVCSSLLQHTRARASCLARRRMLLLLAVCSLPSSLLTFPLWTFSAGGVGGTAGEPPLGTETLVGTERGHGDALPSLLPSLCLCRPARASRCRFPQRVCLSRCCFQASWWVPVSSATLHSVSLEALVLQPSLAEGSQASATPGCWPPRLLSIQPAGELQGAIARLPQFPACSCSVPQLNMHLSDGALRARNGSPYLGELCRGGGGSSLPWFPCP